MAVRHTAWAVMVVLHAVPNTQGQLAACTTEAIFQSVRVVCNLRANACDWVSNGVWGKLRVSMHSVALVWCLTLVLRHAQFD